MKRPRQREKKVDEIEHYIVIDMYDKRKFLDAVNNHIKGGFVPLGGVSVRSTINTFDISVHYSQAMIRYKSESLFL